MVETNNKSTATDEAGYDWAIFNDGGMVEGGLGRDEAVAVMANDHADDDTANISRECVDHAGFDAAHCEECDCEAE
tara:strand:+ start:514 stop:741 length:228 start_codon:yes stop_codon:yes gene_type:complete